MKRIRAQVEYKVPHWEFCNSDNQDMDNVEKHVCKFCTKSKRGIRCTLHDTSLTTDGILIHKARRCKEVTAGRSALIISDSVEEPTPPINPKKIIKQAVSLYVKNVNDLVNQGYPRQMAEKFAVEQLLQD